MNLSREVRQQAIEIGRGIELGRSLSAREFRCKRLAMKRTIREVAEAAGVYTMVVSRYERCRALLAVDVIAQLCQALAALEDAPRKPHGGRGKSKLSSPHYMLDGRNITERERFVFRVRCTKWNARGLRRLSPLKFERAVNAILGQPRLYACIDPRATFEDPVDEVD